MLRKEKQQRSRAAYTLVACTLAMTLQGCGGGGSNSSVASTPPPPPPPPAASAAAIIPAATTGQQFATAGASYATPMAAYTEIDVSSPALADAAQLHVRYNAASQRYEVELPEAANWQPISAVYSFVDGAGTARVLYRPDIVTGLGVEHYRSPSTLQYSALLEWFDNQRFGYSAIGVATAAGAVPNSGTATYTGSIRGATTETRYDQWEAAWYVVGITGSINLAFDFGSGSLSGSISPLLGANALPSLNFTNTVYSSGATSFQGRFATSLAGVNSFSGRFTGPAAQELIGNFAFPYTSPSAGTPEQAAGAFAGRRQ